EDRAMRAVIHEHAAGRDSRGAGGDRFGKMGERTRSAMRDHGNFEGGSDLPYQLTVVSAPGSFPCNRGQQYLTRASLLHLAGKFDGISLYRSAAIAHGNLSRAEESVAHVD